MFKVHKVVVTCPKHAGSTLLVDSRLFMLRLAELKKVQQCIFLEEIFMWNINLAKI